MKVVLITLDDANKIGITGAEKLTKTDELIILYVKGKKNIKSDLEEALSGVKCSVSYEEMATAGEFNTICAYFVGYHEGKGHDVFIVTSDKTKLSAIVKSHSKAYASFKSIATSTGKTSQTSSKKTSSAKTSSNKKSSKKEDDLSGLLTELASGKIDKEKLTSTLVKAAMKGMK